MPVYCKTGQRTAPGSTGNEVITGLGFTPKAIIFWGAGGSVGTDADLLFFLGFSDCAGGRNRAQKRSRDDASAASGGGIWGSNQAASCIYMSAHGAAPTVIADAAVSAVSSDGFTLNWTTRSANFYYNYMAIGGDNVEAYVGAFSTGTTTGNLAITGVGFTPTALILSPQYYWCLGLVDSARSGIGSAFVCDQPASTPLSRSYQQTTYPIFSKDASDTDILRATVVSYDADGFTINKATSSVNIAVPFIALKGVTAVSGLATQPTSNQTQSITTGTNVPAGVLMGSFGHAASASYRTDIKMTLGGSDGTTDLSTSQMEDDGLATTESNRNISNDTTLKVLAAESGNSLQAAANVTGFGPSGFTVDWTTTDATAREWWYFMINNPGNAPRNNMMTLGVG